MNNSYQHLINIFKELDQNEPEYQHLARQLSEKLDHQEMSSLLSLLVRIKVRQEYSKLKPDFAMRTVEPMKEPNATEGKRRRGRPPKSKPNI